MENKSYELKINGKLFKSPKGEINGEELLNLLGLHNSADYEILMKLTDSEFEPIELKELVDLKRPGIEAFQIKPYHSVSIEVDDEKYPVTELLMTPKEIMVLSSIDPQKHYLKQIIGHTDITYKNDADHIIGIKDCMKFSSCKVTSTTVS